MNSSSKKLIAGLSAFSLILTSAAAQVMAETTATSTLKGTRLYGNNRYETAVEISKKGWNSSDYVVLANGEDFADALCAAPLAKKLNAPILLTEKNGLNPAAKAELKRLNAKHVVIIGQYGAVSKSAEDSAKAVTGDVKRIGGADRYETSALIAKELGTSTEVAIASGEDYPDALSIASIAASEKMPILLTSKDALPGKVADYINTNKDSITKTYIIGGEGAVSENAAKAAGKNEVRLGGKDRFDTNAKVLSSFEDELNYKNVYVAVGNGAKGTGFADALSGAALASKTSSPVVLVYKDLAGETVDMLTKELAPKKNVIALGGAAVVPDSIITKINDIKIPAVVFSVDGAAKGSADVSSDNVEVDAKNVTLKDANVSGNVYLYGDGAKLSNVKVAGTVYVDPGENGSVTLENVHAGSIRVRSGAQNSIHLINVQSGKMIVESDNPSNSVRIVSTGTTNITNTIVSSYAILDSNGGTLGTVTITENGAEGKVIELTGTFTDPVVINGRSTVNIAAGTNISALTVKHDSDIKMASGAVISTLTVEKNASDTTLDIAKDGKVTSLSGDGAKTVTVTGEGKANVNTGSGTTGGSGIVIPTPTEKSYYATLTLPDGSSVDINLGTESSVGAMKVEDLYNAKIYNNTANKAALELLADKIKTKIESKNVMVGNDPVNVFVSGILKTQHPALASLVSANDYKGLVDDLLSKNFDQMSQTIHSIIADPINVPQPTIGGKKVTSIEIGTSEADTNKTKYDFSQNSVLPVDFNLLRTKFLGTSSLGNLTVNDLKTKSVYAAVTLEDGGQYILSGSNGVFTLTRGNEKFTFSIAAK